MTDNEFIAYVSGFCDGEGCFHIQNVYRTMDRIYRRPRVQVTNTNLLVLELLSKKWGGTISSVKLCEKHKRRYDWHLTRSSLIVKFISDILPFLLMKKQAAENVLELAKFIMSRKPRKRYTIQDWKYIDKLKDLNISLNRRGDHLAVQ